MHTYIHIVLYTNIYRMVHAYISRLAYVIVNISLRSVMLGGHDDL